jgi:hypothetical protein
MVATIGSETTTTKTVNRYYLLHWQVQNLLSRTTVISQETLAKIDTALIHQWIRTIGVYGLDDSGRCHVGLVLTINWVTHSIHVLVMGEEVSIDRSLQP